MRSTSNPAFEEVVGSLVGVALVAQVHRLLQRAAGGLCLFSHDAVLLMTYGCGKSRRLQPWWANRSAMGTRDHRGEVADLQGLAAADKDSYLLPRHGLDSTPPMRYWKRVSMN
jgi:hypothetical protein